MSAPILFVGKLESDECASIAKNLLLRCSEMLSSYRKRPDKLGKAQCVSVIDLLSGSWKLRVAEKNVPETALSTKCEGNINSESCNVPYKYISYVHFRCS